MAFILNWHHSEPLCRGQRCGGVRTGVGGLQGDSAPGKKTKILILVVVLTACSFVVTPQARRMLEPGELSQHPSGHSCTWSQGHGWVVKCRVKGCSPWGAGGVSLAEDKTCMELDKRDFQIGLLGSSRCGHSLFEQRGRSHL